MPKQCPDCSEIYPDFVDFCVNDGARLRLGVTRIAEEDTDQSDEELTGEYHSAPEIDTEPVDTLFTGQARLYRQVGEDELPEPIEFTGDVVVGRAVSDSQADDLGQDAETFVDLGAVGDEGEIEARHARLSFKDGSWWIEDLSEAKGVVVNQGSRIGERTELASGDRVAFGEVEFVFEASLVEGSSDHGGADNER